MKILVDTNLLTRTAESGHPHYLPAKQAIDVLVLQGHDPLIVPQVLYEFWSVATRPLSANGLGKSPKEAFDEIVKIRAFFRLMGETPDVLDEWEKLVSTLGIIGRNAHDAHLVGAMVAHGIPAILTFNAHDFRRFPGITILDPNAIAAGTP